MSIEIEYATLFEETNDAVFILDLKGNHLRVNQRACDLLGYSKEELLKLSFKELSAEASMSIKNLQKLLKGERLPIYERRFVHKSGEVIPTEVNVHLIKNADGNPLYIQSVIRDLRERKIFEKRILHESTKQRRKYLDSKEIIKGILKELRPPLKRMDLGFKNPGELKEVEDFYRFIHSMDGVREKLAHTLENLENYSLLEEVGLPNENLRTDIRELIKEIYFAVEKQYGSEGKKVLMRIDDHLPRYLECHEKWTRIIMYNLMNTALKHAGDKDIKVFFHWRELDDQMGSLSFFIDLALKKHSFEEITTAFKHLKEGGSFIWDDHPLGGTDFALAYQLIKKMGGDMKIEETPQGKLRILLEMARSYSEEETDFLKDPEELRVMVVVEAHPFTRAVEKALLKHIFPEEVILEFSPGERALEYLKENKVLAVFVDGDPKDEKALNFIKDLCNDIKHKETTRVIGLVNDEKKMLHTFEANSFEILERPLSSKKLKSRFT